MKEFDIEYQWQKFLELMQLDEKRMSVEERRERKRTFVAAFTQAFILFTDVLTKITDDDKAVGMIESFRLDLETYWNADMKP